MTTKTTISRVLSRIAFVGTLAGVAVLVGPAGANKTPVTPQQLQAYDEVFMEQGEKIDPDSDAMKALEAYIYWSNTGSVLVPGKY